MMQEKRSIDVDINWIKDLRNYGRAKLVPFRQGLAPSLIYNTSSFAAGYYSAVPFSKLKRRISTHLFSYPLLSCSLISAGAPVDRRRIEEIYHSALRYTKESKHDDVKKMIKTAVEERIRRGFKPVELPKELLTEILADKKASQHKRFI